MMFWFCSSLCSSASSGFLFPSKKKTKKKNLFIVCALFVYCRSTLIGHVSVQRTNRMPKDIHVEPEKFAAELISRLEAVLREREAQEKLEERLKRVRLVSLLPK